MRRHLGRLFIPFLASVMLSGPGQAADEDGPPIAAASDLQFALTEIAKRFTAEHGKPVRLTMGSSGNFARQIRQGAPFELYLSADEDFALDLAEDGFTRDTGALYAVGRLVMVTPENAPLEPDGSLDSLAEALEAGAIGRFAIANPDHAPYGRAAREALVARGLWEAIEPFIVYGENVSQAAQFAATGNAQGGIIAYSLVLADEMQGRVDYDLIPEDQHAPLRQRMVLIDGAGPVAERFYDYLQEEGAREIFQRYGFLLPGEGND